MKNELEKLKEILLHDKEYQAELLRQDLPFEIAEAIIDARVSLGITQKELAERIGTKQSAIARLEKGTSYPNLKTLEKIAGILGLRMRNPLDGGSLSIDNCYFRLPLVWAEGGIQVERRSERIKNLNF